MTYVGLTFSCEYKDIDTLVAGAGLAFPLEGLMPCGVPFGFASPWEIPSEDTPCACGNPECWLVKWKEQ